MPQRVASQDLVLREALHQFECHLRVAIPGIVQSFNSVKQTVVVQLALRERINVITPDGQGGAAPVPQDVAIDPIVDVPICIPRAGGFSLTLPIQAGDECLVIFSDACFNAWWANGGVQNQEKLRRHSLSDGIAAFGPWSQQRLIPNYSTTKAQLRSDDGVTVVEVGAGEITLTAVNVKVVGALEVTGTITADGDLNVTGHLDGKTFLTHQHTGVATGGGNSGPVL